MIEVLKIINKIEIINPETPFKMNNVTVTRDGMKSKVQRYITILPRSHPNVRVIDHWNRFPASKVGLKPIDSLNSK